MYLRVSHVGEIRGFDLVRVQAAGEIVLHQLVEKLDVLRERGGESIGELSVVFRTQSAALIASMTEFFRLWKRIEDLHLAAATGMKISYALYDGKFVRSLSAPEGDCTAEDLAGAISEYIKLFDKLMKHYLTGRLDAREVEAAYYSYMRTVKLHI